MYIVVVRFVHRLIAIVVLLHRFHLTDQECEEFNYDEITTLDTDNMLPS